MDRLPWRFQSLFLFQQDTEISYQYIVSRPECEPTFYLHRPSLPVVLGVSSVLFRSEISRVDNSEYDT